MNAQQCPAPPANSPEVEAQYPEGSTPEIRVSALSALCSYGLTPLVMQGALRQILIQHFSDSEGILNNTLRKRLERDGVWKENADETGIVIESLGRWRPELTSHKPGLLLKEQEWQWRRSGIANLIHEDWRTGRKEFNGLWYGSHTIFAVAREYAETQILAVETAKLLTWLQGFIAEQLSLQQFVPVSIGAVAAVREAVENYAVPVTVAYVANESWHLQPEAPRLKRIRFTRSATLASY